MIRRFLFPAPKDVEKHLRHQRDPSRLEAFSDGVFGLAVTLLVASQPVPTTFTGLQTLTQQIFPAALSFGVLFGLWFGHCKFFRRYPLEDDVTLRLNGLFLFVLLVGIYPLKFMIYWVGQVLTGTAGEVKVAGGHVDYAAVRHDQILPLLAMYIAFFAATSFCMGLLHWNAYNRRNQLGLNPVEATEAFSNAVNLVSVSSIFLLSLPLLTFFFTTKVGLLSWFGVMASIGFVIRKWLDQVRNRAVKEMESAAPTEA